MVSLAAGWARIGCLLVSYFTGLFLTCSSVTTSVSELRSIVSFLLITVVVT